MGGEQGVDAWNKAIAEHERQLVVGARVKTHVSGECPGPPSLASIGMYEGPARLAHTLPRDDARTGVIAFISHFTRLANDHPYWVTWDGEEFGYYYASAELIPLEDPDPDRRAMPFTWDFSIEPYAPDADERGKED